MSDEARVLELSAGLRDALAQLPGGAPGAIDKVQGELAQSHPRLLVAVLSTKTVPAGAGVSYGHTFVTETPTTLALAAMGYGDGMPRKAGNRAHVTICSDGDPRRVSVVGRVAMNAFVADVGAPGARPGERVTVFGDPSRGEIPLAEWAGSVGESPASVIAAIAARVTLRATA